MLNFFVSFCAGPLFLGQAKRVGFLFVVCSLGPWRGASVENEIKDICFSCFLFCVCSDVCSATNSFLSRKSVQKREVCAFPCLFV